jgi:drug/metabolite transporter (DMT)-like permease
MILELVLFKSPPGMDRAAILEDAKHTIPHWRADPDLVRKHYLVSDDGYGGGAYIWPSKEAAQRGHGVAWREGVKKRTGSEPVIRYFDLLMVLDNENGSVTEWTESGDARQVPECRRPREGYEMFDPSWLWAAFTIVAAAAQTVRNATQRELTARLGTVGATHVRFLFGFPFALIFLIAVMIALRQALPLPPPMFWAWVIDGALAQVAATALMLAAMNDRSFVVVYAYIKTEPVQVALFGLVFLGDAVTPIMAAAILIATTGVVTMALKPGTSADLKSTLLGLGAGAMFALSAVGFRGAILSLALPSFVMAATFTVVVGLMLQSVMLSLYLWLRNPDVLVSIVRAWRPSLFAGFMGALASQFWFLAFALATAASVRTLALVEVLFAQAISRFVFKQPTTAREAVGVVLIVIGVALLLWAG